MNLLMKLLPINVLVWRNNFIDKSIDDYIPDRITDGIKITNDIFFDNIFMSIISSIIVLLTESSFKHQHNISSILCYFLVVSVNYNLLHIMRNGWSIWKMKKSHGKCNYPGPRHFCVHVLAWLWFCRSQAIIYDEIFP